MLDPAVLEEMENLRLAAFRFEQLFVGLPIPCVGMDLEGTIFEWNKAGEKVLGLDPAMLFMSSAYSILCSDEAQEDRLADMLAGASQGQSFESFEWELQRPGQEPRFLLCSMLPKPGSANDFSGAILAGVDMTAQKKYEHQIEDQLCQINEYSQQIELSKAELEVANKQLESLASSDGLTGILNHRAFVDAMRMAFMRPQALSLIMLDVDFFKMFNDTFGHPEGDRVLQTVASSISQASRGNDVVARYGGEEFVVLLPGAKEEAALKVAERIRAAIEGADWPLRQVTASFGVATRTKGCAPEHLVAAADAALYVSKREGKNRVTLGTIEKGERAA